MLLGIDPEVETLQEETKCDLTGHEFKETDSESVPISVHQCCQELERKYLRQTFVYQLQKN